MQEGVLRRYSPGPLIDLLGCVALRSQRTQNLRDLLVQQNTISMIFEENLFSPVRFVSIQSAPPPKIIVESNKLSKIDVPSSTATHKVVMCGKCFEQVGLRCKGCHCPV